VKILLINTPRSPFNSILEYAPEEAKKFIHKKLIGPPLGLLTIAAAVPEQEVIVFDTKGAYDLNPETPSLNILVEELIHQYQPDIVGTTVISSELYYGFEILEIAKNINPLITTVIGGLHVTLCIEDINKPFIDIAIQGHGGNAFRHVVEAKERKKSFFDVNDIWVNTPNGLQKTKTSNIKWDAAGHDFINPNRSLIDTWKTTYKVGGAPSPTTYIFTSLGCPYQCTFCSIWQEYGGGYFKRHIESVVQEIKELDYDIVRFADANTIVDTSYIDMLFTRIEQEGIKKEYIMDIRADTAVNNPKLIEKLARNGLKVVICGFESYKDEELKKYNKSSSAHFIEKAIDIFHNNGIMLRGNYVIPPSYNKADFAAMADYASSHKVNFAGYTILTPMPGTQFFKDVKSQITDWDYRKYNFFNAVLPTSLSLDSFYKEVGKLWLIKKGDNVI